MDRFNQFTWSVHKKHEFYNSPAKSWSNRQRPNKLKRESVQRVGSTFFQSVTKHRISYNIIVFGVTCSRKTARVRNTKKLERRLINQKHNKRASSLSYPSTWRGQKKMIRKAYSWFNYIETDSITGKGIWEAYGNTESETMPIVSTGRSTKNNNTNYSHNLKWFAEVVTDSKP